MDYTVVKKGPKFRLFGEVRGGMPVKLGDYNSRGAAYSTACLLLGRDKGSITVMGWSKWTENMGHRFPSRKVA